MKITRVTFGNYVSVTRNKHQATWRCGVDGISRITFNPDGTMCFDLSGGEYVVIYPPTGTVVTMEPDEPAAATSSARALPAPKARR